MATIRSEFTFEELPELGETRLTAENPNAQTFVLGVVLPDRTDRASAFVTTRLDRGRLIVEVTTPDAIGHTSTTVES